MQTQTTNCGFGFVLIFDSFVAHVFIVGLNISKGRKVGLAFDIPKSGTMCGYFLIFAEVGEQSSEQ